MDKLSSFSQSLIPQSGTATSRDFMSNREGKMSFSVTPIGAAITDLSLQIKLHENDPYLTLIEGTDWASGSNIQIRRASSTPPNLATAGNTSFAILDVGLIHSFRFVITSAASSIQINGVQ